MRIGVVWLLLVCSVPAMAQDFLVTGSSPASGDGTVALSTTVAWTFSAPLDTTMHFSGGGDLPFRFFAISPPDSIRIDSTYFSEDLTQVFFDVRHTEETDYVWVLTGAYDQAGRLLCRPYVLSYTTASEAGSLSVSGSLGLFVTKSGSADCDFLGDRLLAVLLDAPPATLDAAPDAASVVAATVSVDFDYTISHVRPGTYWPAAFANFLEPGVYGSFAGETGFHNWFDTVPDSIIVAERDRTDIRLEIGDIKSAVARTELPGHAALLPSYPNPFNPRTTVPFRLERPARLRLVIYDVLGRRVATVGQGVFPAGRHAVAWEAADAPSGRYMVRLEGEGFALARKVLLVK